MNARILRKWSIHTKNLMSCSVNLLVVVVLLLLVTCAPSLILATMNFRSDAPFAANPPHMPKHAIKEATLSSSSSSSTPSLSSSSPTILTSLLSSLPNRNHRLASSSGVEVVRTPDTNRESFPGFYKNYHADDTQLFLPQYTSGGSSNYRGTISATNRDLKKLTGNQQHHNIDININNNDKLGYLIQPRGWPPRTNVPTANDDSFNDNIKQTYNDKAEGIFKGYETAEIDKGFADKRFVYKRNGNLSPSIPTNQNFPVQQHFYTHHNRRIEDRIQSAAPAHLTLHTAMPTKTLLQLQRTSRTALASASVPASSSALASAPSSTEVEAAELAASSPSLQAHLEQPELIHSYINNFRNVKNIFSTTHNKSAVPLLLPVPRDGSVVGNDNSSVNKIKSSALPLRLIIESYEVPASLPLTKTLTEQQRRMLIHAQHLRQLRTMQQQAARNRRESLHGRGLKKFVNGLHTSSTSSLTATTNFRKSLSVHNLRQHHQQHMRKHHARRYCSARDPAQLAFEAPTVFEGKIVSMTPDRRQNFSATVEVREVFKQQIGYRLQKYLRLQFAYRNNSGECDIYREALRPRGLVRGDTIEPGRLYLLFVQQIDIGNFTILGQPIRKTKRVVEAVRFAVSGNYEKISMRQTNETTNIITNKR